MSNWNPIRDESLKHFSMVTKLVHYSSKFALNEDGRHTKQHPSTRNHRLSSTLDLTDKPNESRRFRLAPIWPEWNDAEINTESWDTGIIKKKDTNSVKTRADTKTNISIPHYFEDPDGKIDLPPLLKVEQWKRPIDFLTPEKPPVIVDPELGIQNFDLITSNEHLHFNETIRNIISQITILWNICRKESKNTNDHTWRPWEHIYALNKVSKQPFITPYNPSGKYVVRLFFMGTWRKIIIDDSIPFDVNNRCLLPQTTLSYELWPMLLSKALLKIISLDYQPSNDLSEHTETSIIHLLTGWIPESIPLKYSHMEKIWNFLRYDRSNKLLVENESQSFGPVSLFKWSEAKADSEETGLSNGIEQLDHSDDSLTKKSDDKSSKKGGGVIVPTVIKTNNIKENRPTVIPNVAVVKDVKKPIGTTRVGLTEDIGVILDDQITPEAPKMIVFATLSHFQPTRISSFTETADRSECLRRYNLNETFSTSVLLTTIRDISLEPPLISSSAESIPAWKLIRPRKPKVFPHAEPIVPQEIKPERWIEISSPYINYPTISALNIKPTIRPHPIPILNKPSRPKRGIKSLNPLNIIETDEDEDNENKKAKSQINSELVRSITSLSLPTTKKELNLNDIQEKSDESVRSAGFKYKREMSIKTPRKSAASSAKLSADVISIKNKGEPEQVIVPISVNTEQQSSQSTSENSIKKSNIIPKIWMDFDDFCACFTSIIVFHNPRGYQFNHKHTEIKFTPYQLPVPIPVTKEKKRDLNQPVIQPIPNLQDDKSYLYLFVDSTRETLEKNIELIISFTCLPRWYDSTLNEHIVLNEKPTRGTNVSTDKLSIDHNLAKNIISQKEIIPQIGSLFAELYSWKSVSIGQPILRLHTTATKSALLTLPPGRHVLKFMNSCPFGFNLQVLSDTNDFMIGDEDQLLNKILSTPENAEFIIQAEGLFLAFDDSIESFHLINQEENKLTKLFRLYCQHAPESIELNIQTCFNAFNQALYSTLRTIFNTSASNISPETQFAWRCFTNDLLTSDILGAYEAKRPTVRSANRHSARSGGNTGPASKRGRDKSSDDKINSKQQPDQEELSSDWLTRELNLDEIDAILNIQKITRGFLQRRIDLARQSGTEKNLTTQRILQSTMNLLKNDLNKSSSLLFRNFISNKPELIQCFSFRNDDWNMVTYRDYNGIYQEQIPNSCFILFRDIFYVTEESLISAKFLCHLPNSILRVINNDTYEEIPLVFNRLIPKMFTKNKHGYTFIAEGNSLDQTLLNGRFRLRLITSYAHLPEIHGDQLISSFITKEILDYYLPNKEQIICRYRVTVTEDINQTGRNFHLASIHFNTSKSDVYMRLTILDNNEEIVSVEGKGSVVLPAFLFMRAIANVVPAQPPSRPTSKTGATRKKDGNNTQRGSISDIRDKNGDVKRRSRSNSIIGLMSIDEVEKPHKYVIQVTLLRKSWPLTLTQWQFVEQLKDHEKDEIQLLDQPSSPTKTDKPNTKRTPPAKGRGGSGKNRSLPNKPNPEKATIDTTKAHWTLRIISDSDKPDELIMKKDTERIEELINIKKAWETLQNGRAEKAMQTRQKFLDSLQIKTDDQSTPDITDEITNISEIPTDSETSAATTTSPPIIEPQQQIIKPILTRKKSPSSIKKASVIIDETPKPIEIIPSEPFLDEPPPSSSSKPKISLPPLDMKPFMKQKFCSNESFISDSIFEQEELESRQENFQEYLKTINKIREDREQDQSNRSNEKLRQFEEYLNLQNKIDQIRRVINQPREVYRQRYLEIERRRLEELAIQQRILLEEEKIKAAAAAAAMIKPTKKKAATGKKKKS